MTQEERQKEKELLLNTLKDGLPYGLQLQITDINDFSFNGELCVLSKNWCRLNIADPVKRTKVKNQTIPLNYIYIKPYLFPLSSMTEEEKEEYCQLQQRIIYNSKGVVNEDVTKYINYCYKKHLDINNLIPMGLAINATGLNIY